VTVNGPLESAIIEQAGPQVGPALTQVLTRALVWWIAVPGELLRHDRIDVLYEERPNEEPVVHAIRFESNKTGKTYTAWRFKAKGDDFPRMYGSDGAELEMRLSPAPVDQYEQVTSLLRDGRRHKGVDFKTPVGTKVKATFDGEVTRRNWNFRGNGNCLEITENGGRRKALFLHLSELSPEMKLGTHVKTGQVIAASGNTGHSFAPHLHYQMMSSNDRVLDPFEQHKTVRKMLPSDSKPEFDEEVRRMESLLGAKVAR
jgi:murein DD-endopeptidase MepM/ murein hydrolase activator NlpD